jgi:hypothetical protein
MATRISLRLLLLLFAICFLAAGYVVSATSSLYEPFILDLRGPLQTFLRWFAFLSLATSVLAHFIPGTGRRTISFFFQVGVIIAFGSGILMLLGSTPCFVREFVERTSLSETLYKSLLCTRYSIKSYIALVFIGFIGCMVMLSAYVSGKRKGMTTLRAFFDLGQYAQ